MRELTLPKLTPSELNVMQVVWDAGESTVTEIMKSVNTENKKSLKRTTIQVQVLRLEEKGWLEHREDGNRFLFSATVPKEQASAEIVRDVREQIFGGSCAELVRTLFDHTEISPAEIQKIRKMIDWYEE
jgi:BlaI family penicillinase repressor